MNNILSALKKYVSNFPGWSTSRNLLIIESDDWGSIRMRSQKDKEELTKKGVLEGFNRYNWYDTLASKDDLSSLYEVLSRHKDKLGNPAVFTPITITGNPDFERIRNDNYEKYYVEPFTKTLDRYFGNHQEIIQAWKQGMNAGIFKPQFHGREHLNVAEWMRALKNGDEATHTAFKHGVWGFDLNKSSIKTISSYQAAFDLYDLDDLKVHTEAIREGLEFFESIYGYKATFFVPPNGQFNNSLNKVVADCGIKYMMRSKFQIEPIGNGETQKVYHKLGEKNEHNLITLTRNCVFEPSEEGKDWVDSCLSDVKAAFRMRKPAVISTHRVNYIGALDESNRKRGLKQLDQLLTSITKNWPDVEFITSDQLGDIISGNEINGQ